MVYLEKFSVIFCLQKVYIKLTIFGGKEKKKNLSLFSPIIQSPNCLKNILKK